jgi:DNA-directed RNA polymerase subunit K/omega
VNEKKAPSNAFEFVVVAGARAHQLLRGCTPKVAAGTEKPARLAQREVKEGLISKVSPED